MKKIFLIISSIAALALLTVLNLNSIHASTISVKFTGTNGHIINWEQKQDYMYFWFISTSNDEYNNFSIFDENFDILPEVYLKDERYTMSSSLNDYTLAIASELTKETIYITDWNGGSIAGNQYKKYDPNFIDSNGIKYYLTGEEFEIWLLPTSEVPKSKPGISGKDTILNNIDKPYELNELAIIAGIKVRDDYYGDITHLLKIDSETYSINSTTVGAFEVNYSATNEYGLTTNYKLNVVNQDLTKPRIEGPDEVTISYTDTLDNNNIIKLFTVTDNYDKGIMPTIESTDYVQGTVGRFIYKISAKDSSNNISYKDYIVNAIDDISPEIMDEQSGIIQLNWKDNFTDSKLLLGLTAYDDIDGEITSSIRITSNNLKKKLGEYSVFYEAKDKSGNTIKYERKYQVITTDAPEFWVSQSIISIEDVNVISITQIANIIARYENIEMQSYRVIKNDYLDNENIKGKYEVQIAITSTSGIESNHERIMNVFTSEDLNTDVDTFWYKLKNVFINIWNVIKSIFVWIWTAIKFIWKYTFGLLINFFKGLFSKNALMFFLKI